MDRNLRRNMCPTHSSTLPCWGQFEVAFQDRACQLGFPPQAIWAYTPPSMDRRTASEPQCADDTICWGTSSPASPHSCLLQLANWIEEAARRLDSVFSCVAGLSGTLANLDPGFQLTPVNLRKRGRMTRYSSSARLLLRGGVRCVSLHLPRLRETPNLGVSPRPSCARPWRLLHFHRDSVTFTTASTVVIGGWVLSFGEGMWWARCPQPCCGPLCRISPWTTSDGRRLGRTW